MNYTPKQLDDMLMELDISQIEKVRDEYRREHPQEKTFSLMCQNVINKKRTYQHREEFAELIQRVKNESAPSSGTNTEQGK